MRSKLRHLRILPIVLLLLLIILFVLNLMSKRRAFTGYPFGPSGSADTTALLFNYFSGHVCKAFPGDSLGAPGSLFHIEPNERQQRLACVVHCRLAGPGPVRLNCTWYKGSNAAAVDRLVLTDADSVLTAFHTVGRGDAGNWSVDLTLQDGKLLRTFVFNIILVKHSLPYKSLMKEGGEKGGS